MRDPDKPITAKKERFDRYINVSVDVIIPAYKPGRTLAIILERLAKQTVRPAHVLIFNTEEKYWDRKFETVFPDTRVVHIEKKEFDHGATRHAAAAESKADIVIFMTQDAVPAGKDLVENLISPILRGEAKVAYARQLPKEDAGLIERTGREFNYPAESRIKSSADIEELGIKTFFCSDVCAAYDRAFYLEQGGFPRPVIFNEDMIFAGRTIEAGEKIAYVSDAAVYHSHNLSLREQFRRNYDLGVSQADYADFFDKYPSVGEGKKLVRTTADNIIKMRKYHLLFSLFASSAFKYAGYWFGKHYKKLPGKMARKLSSDPEYWTRKETTHV